MKNIAIAATIAGAMTFASQSFASTVDYQVEGNSFGTQGLYEIANISSSDADDYSGYVYAGAFAVVTETLGDILAWCIDLTKHIGDGHEYSENSSLLGGGVLNSLDRLFTSVYSDVDTAEEAAAFQLAIWEITHEDGEGLSLGAGSFQAASDQYAPASTVALGQSYLDGLASAGTGAYRMTLLESSTSQNLVTVSPVPLPAPILMLGAGLLALFGLKRRKAATA